MSYEKISNHLFAKLENGSGYNDTYNNDVLNPYVNFHKSGNEQALYDSLVAESIQMRGAEAIYIRREADNVDLVFGEDPTSKFKKNYRISIYVESFEGWEGDGDWYSKFGYQVNDQMNVTVNPGLFARQGDGQLPLIGDLIYFPMANALFEVNWVEHDAPWYITGTVPQRKLKLSRFVYSGEEINLEPNEHVISTIDELFSEADERQMELDRVNNLNGRWDITVEEGNEVQQMKDEGSEFITGHTVEPPGLDSKFVPEAPVPAPEPPANNLINTSMNPFDEL